MDGKAHKLKDKIIAGHALWEPKNNTLGKLVNVSKIDLPVWSMQEYEDIETWNGDPDRLVSNIGILRCLDPGDKGDLEKIWKIIGAALQHKLGHKTGLKNMSMVLAFTGTSGSGKSEMAEFMCDWLDSKGTKLKIKNSVFDEREITQALLDNAIVIVDNTNYIPKEASDQICSLSTGIGQSIRRMYSQEIINAKGYLSFIITSIEGLDMRREDLSSRLWIVELEKSWKNKELALVQKHWLEAEGCDTWKDLAEKWMPTLRDDLDCLAGWVLDKAKRWKWLYTRAGLKMLVRLIMEYDGDIFAIDDKVGDIWAEEWDRRHLGIEDDLDKNDLAVLAGLLAWHNNKARGLLPLMKGSASLTTLAENLRKYFHILVNDDQNDSITALEILSEKYGLHGEVGLSELPLKTTHIKASFKNICERIGYDCGLVRKLYNGKKRYVITKPRGDFLVIARTYEGNKIVLFDQTFETDGLV